MCFSISNKKKRLTFTYLHIVQAYSCSQPCFGIFKLGTHLRQISERPNFMLSLLLLRFSRWLTRSVAPLTLRCCCCPLCPLPTTPPPASILFLLSVSLFELELKKEQNFNFIFLNFFVLVVTSRLFCLAQAPFLFILYFFGIVFRFLSAILGLFFAVSSLCLNA